LLRLVRIVLFILLGLVMADDAAGRCTQDSMVTGNMTGGAANRCALEAAFGFRRSGGECDSERQGGAAYKSLHRSISVVLDSNRGVRIRS
jgi:hypothetical protein